MWLSLVAGVLMIAAFAAFVLVWGFFLRILARWYNKGAVIEADFTEVTNPENLPAIPRREPILSPGWQWGLFWFVAIFGGLTLLSLYRQGAWPFAR